MPDPSVEAAEVRAAAEASGFRGPVEGETWYLISSKWYRQWCNYTDSVDLVPSSPTRYRATANTLPADFSEDSDEEINVSAKYASSRPEPIDNSPLVSRMSKSADLFEMVELKPNLLEQLNFVLVPQPVWKLIFSWYGGGPEIPRPVVRGPSGDCFVEIYPIELNISFVSGEEVFKTRILVSKTSTISEVKARAMQKLDLLGSCGQDEIEVWNVLEQVPPILLRNEKETVAEAVLVSGQQIQMRPKNDASDTFQKLGLGRSKLLNSQTSSLVSYKYDTDSTDESTGSSESMEFDDPSNTIKEPENDIDLDQSLKPFNCFSPRLFFLPPVSSLEFKRAGLCGLVNLGNTCFMNAALQCLSNTAKVTEYFLSGVYRKDINRENPLGMRGVIAEEYYKLLCHLWNGKESSFAPRQLKFRIALHAPQFTGYQQQDSQELMAFLLDGLHEDLNRIKQKPYVEVIEGGDRPDDEVAAVAWQQHLQRNNSIVVDLFQGQYKSTVIFPSKNERSIEVLVFLRNTEQNQNSHFSYQGRPMKYQIRVIKRGKIGEVREKVSALTGVSYSLLVSAIIFLNRFYRVPVPDSCRIDEAITESSSQEKLVFYEVQYPFEGNCTHNGSYGNGEQISSAEDKVYLLKVVHCENNSDHPASVPFVITLKKFEFSGKRLLEEIMFHSRRFFNYDSFFGNISVNRGESDNTCGTEIDNSSDDSPSELFLSGTETDKQHNMVGTDIRKGKKRKSSSKYPFQVRLAGERVQPGGGIFDSIHINLDSDRPVRLPDSSSATLLVEWKLVGVIKELFNSEEASFRAYIPDPSSQSNTHKGDRSRPTIEDCLCRWSEKEILSEDNAWYCPVCKDHKQASKHLQLWSTPEVLIIHLKRFSYSIWSRNKVETFVEYPLRGLDLYPYIVGTGDDGAPAPIYDLYAVCNHFGGLGGGHYTAYAISPWKVPDNESDPLFQHQDGYVNGSWYNFDDSSVSKTDGLSSSCLRQYVCFILS
eukprot:jgi/Galph1/5578/GphlegSOOS_G4277.1